MRIKIIVPGVYNGRRHRRLGYIDAGTVIDTEPGYGEELVRLGLATLDIDKKAANKGAEAANKDTEAVNKDAEAVNEGGGAVPDKPPAKPKAKRKRKSK